MVWISLGTFRFMPPLKAIIEDRFPRSKIVYGEFINGLDGKMRYFKPLRIDLYRKIISWIRELAPDVRIYLCMEDEEVWEKAFGFTPSEMGGLHRMLDDSAAIHCDLDRI
jgi:spore photoproduct lyase